VAARRHPATKGKLSAFQNGVRPDRVVLDVADNPGNQVLCVGNITWKKNIAHAVRIFRIVKKTIPTATLTV